MLDFWYAAALVGTAVLWLVVTIALVRREDGGTERERRTEYEAPDFGGAAGFCLTGCPDDEIGAPLRFWLIENTIAEIDYAVTPGKYLTLRAARSGQMRMPRGYGHAAFEREARYSVGGVTVTQRQSAGRRSLAAWRLDGFDFMIYSDEPEMNMLAGLACVFAAAVRAVPTQRGALSLRAPIPRADGV